MFKLSNNILSVIGLSLLFSPLASLNAYSKQPVANDLRPDLVTYFKSEKNEAPPLKLIEEVTENLLAELKRYKNLKLSTRVEKANELVAEIIGPTVDFPLIARRVMAKHFHTASPKQRAEFVEVFRQSLVNTYALGLASYSNEKIVIMPFSGIKQSGSRKRASVMMKVFYNDGDVTPIVYALYEDQSGQWRLENLVLNGVNLGLTFRTQFNESVVDHKGNLDRVIASWNTEVADTQ